MYIMQRTLRISAALVLACLMLAGLTWADDWDYSDGENGPNHWEDHFPICGQSSQSPIDLVTDKVSYSSDLSSFKFTGYDQPAPDAKPSLKNNGHTAQVDLIDGEYTVEDGGLPGVYKAVQFHFHWGSDNSKGSEHVVDGKAYPLEMHIVHYSDEYDDLQSAADKDEGLAVLGIFFEIGDSENAAFTDVVNHLKNVSFKGQTVNIANFALGTLLPSDTKLFYRYSGSLTTPKCYQSVIWTVFQTTVLLSQQQIDKFRQIFENEDDDDGNTILVNNFRPVQPLNERPISSTNPQHQSSDSSAPTVSAALLVAAFIHIICQLL